MCRNFWGYLNEDDIINCAKKLYKKLDDSSIVIIGEFDMDKNHIPKFLTELGIDSTNVGIQLVIASYKNLMEYVKNVTTRINNRRGL